MYWNLLAIPFFIPALAIYIGARRKNDLATIRFAQPLATLVTVACAVLGFLAPQSQAVFGVLVAIGLVVSVCADGILIDIDDKSLVVAGSAIFSGVLLLYSAAVIVRSGFSPVNLYTGAAMLIVFACIVVFLWKGAGTLRAPVLTYSFVWCFVMSLALAAVIGAGRIRTGSILFLSGLALFFVADSLMSMNYFIRPVPKSLVAAFYGLGQMLIALSLGY